MTLYVQYTKNQDLEYIATIHFVCLYPNLMTFYVQYTKTLAVKSGFYLSLYVQYIVTIHFVCPYPNLLTLYV